MVNVFGAEATLSVKAGRWLPLGQARAAEDPLLP